MNTFQAIVKGPGLGAVGGILIEKYLLASQDGITISTTPNYKNSEGTADSIYLSL